MCACVASVLVQVADKTIQGLQIPPPEKEDENLVPFSQATPIEDEKRAMEHHLAEF